MYHVPIITLVYLTYFYVYLSCFYYYIIYLTLLLSYYVTDSQLTIIN